MWFHEHANVVVSKSTSSLCRRSTQRRRSPTAVAHKSAGHNCTVPCPPPVSKNAAAFYGRCDSAQLFGTTWSWSLVPSADGLHGVLLSADLKTQTCRMLCVTCARRNTVCVSVPAGGRTARARSARPAGTGRKPLQSSFLKPRRTKVHFSDSRE